MSFNEFFKKHIRKIYLILVVILGAFLINTVVLLLTGKDVAMVYSTLFTGAFGDQWSIANSIRWALPLMFTGLAFAVAFRGGMFNVGAEGQLYLGAFAAAWVGFTFIDLPKLILIPLCIIAAGVVGAAWSMLAGWLKLKFKANEVVTTLMLNYVAILFTEYLIRYPFYEPGTAGESGASKEIASQAMLNVLLAGSNITTGIFFALILIIIVYYWNTKTSSGYEINIIGNNERFANFSGIQVPRGKMLVMAVSGAIAGFGGAIEILGIHHRFIINFSNGLGFDGIVVSLLSNNNPLFIPLSALFMGAMKSGGITLEMVGDVPKAMVNILLGVIIMLITIKKVPFLSKSKK
ncbi:ABC transporter permease [Bacillus sp. S3]|uniref:ABC transporter permease n=1 Tax=Bacillus sp. S3 TaxID=486398 RepID=UPI00168190F8|nr:ABC transporter permease [Bacillus sp. S3]